MGDEFAIRGKEHVIAVFTVEGAGCGTQCDECVVASATKGNVLCRGGCCTNKGVVVPGQPELLDGHIGVALGITGVPFFVVAGRYAVSGAQPPEIWTRLMDELDAATSQT